VCACDVSVEAIEANFDNDDGVNPLLRSVEEVVEQPSILSGGRLKEYQLVGLQW
jgi:hypothetical protein